MNVIQTHNPLATNVHIRASLIQLSHNHLLNGSIPALFRAQDCIASDASRCELLCVLLLVVRFAAFCSPLSTSCLATSRCACGCLRLATCHLYSLWNVGVQYLARGRNKHDILTNGRAWVISEPLINWNHATFLVFASCFTYSIMRSTEHVAAGEPKPTRTRSAPHPQLPVRFKSFKVSVRFRQHILPFFCESRQAVNMSQGYRQTQLDCTCTPHQPWPLRPFLKDWVDELPPTIESIKNGWQTTCQSGVIVVGLKLIDMELIHV